jgi:NTE family protein
MDVTPNYAGEYLIPTMLTGAGVGFSFASWGSAAVAELPPARFATGSAVLSCLRQVGAVLGIAVLVAVLAAAPPGDPLAGFVDAWTLMAVAGGIVAVLTVALGRVRAGAPAAAPAEAAA